MREILDALEWARLQMLRRGSPDFIRQRELARCVSDLAARLARGPATAGAGPPAKIEFPRGRRQAAAAHRTKRR